MGLVVNRQDQRPDLEITYKKITKLKKMSILIGTKKREEHTRSNFMVFILFWAKTKQRILIKK